MGRLFDSPWPILIIIVVALLLFGAPKLPGMARSVGQSLRIFKSEVKQMKDDGTESNDHRAQASAPVEGRIINPQQHGQGGYGPADQKNHSGQTSHNGAGTGDQGSGQGTNGYGSTGYGNDSTGSTEPPAARNP